MKILDGKIVKQSLVKDFYRRHPSFDSRQNSLLDHRPAHRWFQLLKYAADEDIYNFQEVMQGKSGAEVIKLTSAENGAANDLKLNTSTLILKPVQFR